MSRIIDFEIREYQGGLFVHSLQLGAVDDHIAREDAAVPSHTFDVFAPQDPAVIFANV